MKTITAVIALLVLSLLVALPAPAAVVGYFSVRGVIPTSASLGQPYRWSAVPEGDLSNHPCILWLNSYGSSAPNGYYEFPSTVFSGIGVAADWCRGLSPGQTVCGDGQIVSPPDTYGQTYLMTSAHLCQ